MPEFTEFPIPRKDVADTTETQKTAIRTALGVPAAADLINVDNTADADKPVSTATQAAIDTEAATRLAADNRRAYAGGVAFADAGKMSMAVGANDFGTADFSLVFDRLGLDDWTPTTNGELWSSHSAGNNRLTLSILTTGVWRITITDGAAATTNYDITPSSALTNGTIYSIALKFDRDDLATLYADGSSIGTVNIAAASAIDIGSGNANAGELLTDANLSGTASGIAPFNRALTASEALALSTQGLRPWLAANPENMWGGESFAGTGAWANGNDTFTTITSASYSSLDFTLLAESGAAYSGLSTHRLGKKLLIPYTLTVNSGTLPAGSKLVFVPTSAVGLGTAEDSTAATLEVGSHVAEIEFTAEQPAVDGKTRLAIKVPSGTCDVSISFDPIVFAGALAAIPMDEGAGRQLRDLSGRYDALLSETGYQHLQPKNEGYVRVKAADASSAIYMIEASDIIPADSVITDIIAEERKVSVANTAQDLADNRIRLNPSGSDLQIQRSDGTNHTTLGTVTAPTSLADIDAELHYKQQAR